MSKENETKDAPITNEQLVKMLLDTQKQLASALDNMATAQRESRVPYVDPGVLAQKKQALEDRKKQVEAKLLQIRITKEQCPHLRVDSDGNPIEGKYNIKWQQHSQGIILGVCGTCFSQFNVNIISQKANSIKGYAPLEELRRRFEKQAQELADLEKVIRWMEKNNNCLDVRTEPDECY